MKRFYNKLTIITLATVFIACSTEDDVVDEWVEVSPTPTFEDPIPSGEPGSLDFSNYISIGNSLTAGFADFALYNEGQENSFPNLLATQFAFTQTGVEFNQPDINSVNGFNGAFSDVANGVIAGRTVLSLSLLAPVPTAGELIAEFSGDKGSLNNFGVPGLSLADLDRPGYGFPEVGNPYFNRFAADPSTSNVLGDALGVERSFFSFWLGSNDYLGYASEGGQDDEPLTVYSGAEFGADLASALTQLTSDGTPGVVLDLPPVVTLPFFQAVRWNAIAIDEATAQTLNTSLAAVNGAIQATALAGNTEDVSNRLINYSAGANPILVHDEELTDLGPFFDALVGAEQISEAQRASLVPYEQSRPLVDGELVLFSAASLLNTEADGDDSIQDTPIGVVIPLGFSFTEAANGDQYYLTVAEQTAIVTARATYNGAIAQTVAGLQQAGADIALVSVQSEFVDLLGLTEAAATALVLPTESADGQTGLVVNGITLTPDFTPTGVYSTDGIHPNARGHGVIANLVIEQINARWGASIPFIDILSLQGPFFEL